MIVSRQDARKIIAELYGVDFKYRITRSCTVGVRPAHDPRPTLAWRALTPGRDSAVRLGRLNPDFTIDWNGIDVRGSCPPPLRSISTSALGDRT